MISINISNTFILATFVFCLSSTSASRLLTDNFMRLHSELHGMPEEVSKILERVRDRGVEWLLSQKTEEFGWQSGDTSLTASVVIALASAVDEWPAKNDLVARLIVKQLEIELLEKLLRKDIDPVTPAKLAFFSMALGAVCKDPHNFYGHNLVASVEKHHEDQDFPGYPETFGFSLTSLVTCLAGSHLHKRQTRHLVQIVRDEFTMPYSIDTRGTALMALECIRHRMKSETLFKRMHEPLEAISAEQKADGSFGNIHTTAIAIQALGASGDYDVKWNRTAAALALSSMQETNGSFFNNIFATSESVMAASVLLNGTGLLGLRRGHCNNPRHRYRNKHTTTSNIRASVPATNASESTSEESSQPKTNSELSSEVTHGVGHTVDDSMIISNNTIGSNSASTSTVSHRTSKSQIVSVRYWLWIGPDPPTAQRYNLTVEVPVNSTFFFVMQRAAELSTQYEFSSTVWPNGHYIHTISGSQEQAVGYHYWLLYLLKSDPDPQNPPSTTFVAPAGVDDLRVQDSQVYLFWFKKI